VAASTNYIKALLAPYCFGLTIKKAAPSDRASDRAVARPTAQETIRIMRIELALFIRYLRRDRQLHDMVFGKHGYVEQLYRDARVAGSERISVTGPRDGRYLKLYSPGLFGEFHTNRLRDAIQTLCRRPKRTLRETKILAYRYLYVDIRRLVYQCNLATADRATGQMIRFRHNRMREYFAALFLDKVGVRALEAQGVDLSNAWLTEPLRIYAAITSDPVALLERYTSKVREAAPGVGGQFLLESASEAVAYLPNRRWSGTAAKELFEHIHGLGDVAGEPLMRERTTGVRSLNEQQLQNALLVLGNLFGSEFYQRVRREEKFVMATARQNRQQWTQMHSAILGLPGAYQKSAYQHLFPVARRTRMPGTSRFAQFFYVMHSALCFSHYFRRFIVDLRPEWVSRTIPFCGFMLEKLVAAGFWLWMAVLLYPLASGLPRVVVLVACGAGATTFAAIALIAKSKGWFYWSDLWHVPVSVHA
jgi:hypothetical protein